MASPRSLARELSQLLTRAGVREFAVESTRVTSSASRGTFRERSRRLAEQGVRRLIEVRAYGAFSVSVTHTRGLLLVAVARDVRIGIDLEFERTLSPKAEARIMGKIHRRDLSPLQVWVAREATLKADEDSNARHVMEYSIIKRGVDTALARRKSARWNVFFSNAPGIYLALAVAEGLKKKKPSSNP